MYHVPDEDEMVPWVKKKCESAYDGQEVLFPICEM